MPVAFRVEYAVAEPRNGRPDVHGSEHGTVREQVGEALVQRGQDSAALDQRGREVLRAERHRASVRLHSMVSGRGTPPDADGGSGR